MKGLVITGTFVTSFAHDDGTYTLMIFNDDEAFKIKSKKSFNNELGSTISVPVKVYCYHDRIYYSVRD